VEVEVDDLFKTRTYHDLAPVRSSYPADANATTDVSVFRCTPKAGMEKGNPWPVHLLERWVCPGGTVYLDSADDWSIGTHTLSRHSSRWASPP
jgi:hypothetical protein